MPRVREQEDGTRRHDSAKHTFSPATFLLLSRQRRRPARHYHRGMTTILVIAAEFIASTDI